MNKQPHSHLSFDIVFAFASVILPDSSPRLITPGINNKTETPKPMQIALSMQRAM
jgi:hypothetical protein